MTNPMQSRAAELTRDLVLSKLPAIGEPERDEKGVHFRHVWWQWEPPVLRGEKWDIVYRRSLAHMTADTARRVAAELLLAAEISDAMNKSNLPLGPALDRMDYVRGVLAQLGDGES